MNKIKGFVKKNYKVVIGIIIGITISIGIGVSAVATKDITYDNSKSGLTSTNLQGAIDELYEKAINSGVPIDPDTFKTNSAKTIYASSKGICIFRNNKLNCFKYKNYDEERNHIQEVFSDVSCDVPPSYGALRCDASDFNCYVHSADDTMQCIDKSDNSFCYLGRFGDVNCN